MNLVRNPQSIWHFVETDSRSVEICSAILIGVLSASCWGGEWFSGWLGGYQQLAGLEWVVAVAGGCLSAWQLGAVMSGCAHHRQIAAMGTAFALLVLAGMAFVHHGWGTPAGPAFLTGALIQGWVYLALQSDICDARHRHHG